MLRGTVLLCCFSSVAFSQAALRGFSAKDVPAEQKLEQQAQEIPDPANLRRYMSVLAGTPHTAGSPASHAAAQYILRRLQEWGFDAHIEQFQALLPYPTARHVEVLSPQPYTAKLEEPPVAEDSTSNQADQIPPYNAYGASGDVTADVVYANFGLPEDYDWLAKQGIGVKGKIVLTRYGHSWRGLKPKLAAEHGAVACLIYSDPHEDGYFDGDTYPKGPMRPQDGVQRGSVLDITVYPGDPLSPGWASEKGAKRLPRSEAKTLMKIPVLPLSYADAQPILSQLTGPLVPAEWRGSLPLTYHAGPGPARVHMKTAYDWTIKPLYDVIATIPGSEEPDTWVLIGNHHDAWVHGADDPISGASALLETARTLGAMQKQGWTPKRTIKIAFWDGEEFGLMGSTEWVEKHQAELRQKAAVYMNSDNTARGWLDVDGSHTLQTFVSSVEDSVAQPAASGTSSSAGSLLEYRLHHPPDPASLQTPPPAQPFSIGALGAGSDYQPFLDFIGVASLNASFGGQVKSGIYHSSYDSIYWYTHFSDTNETYGKALSQYSSTALLRLGNAAVLPFEFGALASTVNGYLDEIQKEADTSSHHMDFAALRKDLDTLKASADKYNALLEAAELKGSLDPARTHELNQILIRTERSLTRAEGLPGRPWYKHQLYAPGYFTGYAVKTLPGIREAVEAKNWPQAQHETGVLEQCLGDLNTLLDQAVDKTSGF